MSARTEEKEILAKLAERKTQETMQLLDRLLHLRLERYKDGLITDGSELKRGRASEVKDLRKSLDMAV